MENFNLKKLNDVEVREQYQDEIANRSPTLDVFYDNVNINRSWKVLHRIWKIHPQSRLSWVETAL